MAARVTWSKEALGDVGAIAEYIARDSSGYAATVVQRLLGVGRSLQRFPFSGRVVPEVGDRTIREVQVYSYRVIYRTGADVVTVIAVVHSRRQLNADDLPSERR
jgi:plasmid stabilization system protein ParE